MWHARRKKIWSVFCSRFNLSGVNRIDIASIASGKTKEKAGRRTQNRSRFSLVSGSDEIDPVPAASGKVKEKAQYRMRSGSRFSLMSSGEIESRLDASAATKQKRVWNVERVQTQFGAGEHSKSEPEASLLETSCISLKVIFFVPSL